MGHTLYSPNPIIPYHNSVGQTEVKKFGGLLTSEFMPAPIGRSFQMRQTYRHNVEGPIPDNLRRLIADPRKPKGPPTHFHQFQTEYFKVEEGICIVEINGVPRNVTPDDEEISCKPGNVHAFYIHPDSPEKMTILLSASDTGMDYQLDRVFFENWYGYWHDALLYRGGLDLIQTLQIHDAGDHYTPAPAWMPFRTFFGYWACVIIGRWLGGLLGYKPFFKEYTTDWDFAVSKMKGNFFTRWNVHESYADKPSWEKQVEMSSHPKPTNAEYEELVTDMTETFRSSQSTNGVNEVMYGDESPTSRKAKVHVKGEVNGALNGDTVTPLRKRV